MNMDDFGFYFSLGWQHIISWDALDHILFITALAAVYTVEDWRQVLVLITAFTIGHSITLVLSVTNVIRFPDRWVEFLIPCTIVATALSNLFRNSSSQVSMRVNYYLALFFGLIHGMGFANTIRFMLARDQHLGMSLFAFNVGLEVGQVCIVTGLLLCSFIFIHRLQVKRREWILFLSAASFGIAVKMAIERIPIK